MTKTPKASANIQTLLTELENPESGVKEYGISIDDALYLIKYIRSLESQNTSHLSPSAAQIEALKKELLVADDCLFCYPEPIGRRHEAGCPVSRLLGYCKEMEKKQDIMKEGLERIANSLSLCDCETKEKRCSEIAKQALLLPTISE